uniref:Predicted protein n=1 Tax=Hordeum vulgare subsp. vulgare TaxID=112509 RepID=F2D9V4_HORVV|nr:predicted protein [Hordeum vulgare subsp. vulgare]BAJ94905.1 predicted protein [Hordeum vulgare subsp. vulgare]
MMMSRFLRARQQPDCSDMLRRLGGGDTATAMVGEAGAVIPTAVGATMGRLLGNAATVAWLHWRCCDVGAACSAVVQWLLGRQ